MTNNLSIHQINTVTGDLEGNTKKIIDKINEDCNNDIFLSIFPETSITGYMCGSLWDNLQFIKDQLDCLQQIIEKTPKHQTVILGYISFHGVRRNGLLKLKNTVGVINEGRLLTYDKQLLADADHHEDKKYFTRGKETKIFDLNITGYQEKIKIGIPLCEDIWYTDHSRNIAQEMVDMGAELIISINQSYFYYGKQQLRYNLLSKLANDLNVPIIYVNAVGVGDIVKNIIIFDGGSMVFDNIGNLVNELPQFQENSEVIYFNDVTPIFFEKRDKYEELTNAFLFEQREFFKLCNIKNAQVHLSGGVDSAVVAVLVAKAMGKDNTIFITNPSNLNSGSLKYVNYISDKLGIKCWVNPIEDIANLIIKTDEESFKDSDIKIPNAGFATAHAVLRTVQGIMASHRFKSGIVSTGNHTESVLGWCSFHDIGSIGVHALIGDLTKMEVFELAHYLNKKFDNPIPNDILNDVFEPSAELPDSDKDPFDYKIQSGICAEIIRNRTSRINLLKKFKNKELSIDLFPYQEHVYSKTEKEFENEIDLTLKRMPRSVYKDAQAPPKVNISPRSRGFSNRETLINKYKY